MFMLSHWLIYLGHLFEHLVNADARQITLRANCCWTVSITTAVAVTAAVSCSELGTSTDNSTVNHQTPVSIKFTPSLTYAEKLLLKKNRRMELPTPELLSSSRSCHSVLESDHYSLQTNHLDGPPGCHASTKMELASNTNNSSRGM